MNKRLERFLSAAAVLSVAASAMTSFPVQAVEEENIPAITAEVQAEDDNTKHYTEKGGDSNCIIYKPDEEGEISVDLNKSDRSFCCSWEDTNRVDFSVFNIDRSDVFNTDEYKKYYLKYSANIKCKESFGFGAVFNCYEEKYTIDPSQRSSDFTEVRIFESYSGIEDISKENSVGSITVNGVDYNLYRTKDEIDGVTANIIIAARALSLPANVALSGIIDIKAFCDELKKQDIRLTYPKDLQTFVQTYGKSGSVTVNRNELIKVPYHLKIDVPNNGKEGKIVYRDGLSYILWQKYDDNSNSMKVEGNGEAVCKYVNSKKDSECIYRKGITKDNGIRFKDVNIAYNAVVGTGSEDDVYAAGIYYCLGDYRDNFYIVNYRRSDEFINDAELIGTVDIDGLEYNLYKKVLKDFITNTGKPYTEYWCVSSIEFESRGYGMKTDVDLMKYIDAWKKTGIDAGDTLYEVSVFGEFFGKGNSEFYIRDVDIDIDETDDENRIVLEPDTSYVDKDGYRYYSSGKNGSCIIESNGSIIGKNYSEQDGKVYSFRKGLDFGSDPVDPFNDDIRIHYTANISTDGYFQLEANGTMRGLNNEPYIKFHIIDQNNHVNIPKTAESLGQKLVSGEMCELYIYHTSTPYQPGGRCIDEYYTIRKGYSGSHENYKRIIFLNEYIRAWKEIGLPVGDLESMYLDFYAFNKGDTDVELYDSTFVVLRNDDDITDYTVEDVQLLTKFLLGEKCDIEGRDFDLNGDGVWDTFDLIMLKQKLNKGI